MRRWVNRRRKMRDSQVRQYVCQRLERYWSPDQIAGRSRREFRRQPQRQISRQTIYNWIPSSPSLSVARGVLACASDNGVVIVDKTRAGCPTRFASTAGQPSSPCDAAMAIGKEIRSSGVATWAACCPWWSARAASRCWPGLPITAHRPCVTPRKRG